MTDLLHKPAERAGLSDEGAIVRMSQAVRARRAAGLEAISLTLGEPDFDTPRPIQEAATAAMAAGKTHYSPVAGIPELRQALAKKLLQENQLHYAETEIVVANGAKQALANAILATVNPGDEVVLLAPYWVSYELLVRLAGGIPVIVTAGVEEGFKPAPARIAQALSPRTRLLILNSPSNPTGAVWTRAELEDLAHIVAAHPRLLVISDEIYEYIIFDGEAASFGSLPGMGARTISVNGFSKSFAMTGWRLGYAAAPEPVARAMARMQSAISAGANYFVQIAAVTALEGERSSVIAMRDRYRHRRDLVLNALRSIDGIVTTDIPATFYAFPDISAYLDSVSMPDVTHLCNWLLDAHGVATVPGLDFGAPQCLRLSFATDDASLQSGLSLLVKGFAELRAKRLQVMAQKKS